MSQTMQVLKCFSCNMFQVHIVKKSTKWECKICGEKQSIKKVLAKGNGKDCRIYVQKLNVMKQEQNQPNVILKGSNDCDSNCVEVLEPYVKDAESKANHSGSKWSKYLPRSEGDECAGMSSSEDENIDCFPRKVVFEEELPFTQLAKSIIYNEKVDFDPSESAETITKVNTLSGSADSIDYFQTMPPIFNSQYEVQTLVDTSSSDKKSKNSVSSPDNKRRKSENHILEHFNSKANPFYFHSYQKRNQNEKVANSGGNSKNLSSLLDNSTSCHTEESFRNKEMNNFCEPSLVNDATLKHNTSSIDSKLKPHLNSDFARKHKFSPIFCKEEYSANELDDILNI